MATKRRNELFSSILYIIVGVLIAVFPANSLSLAMTIAGVIFVVSGALELIKKNWIGGAISLVIGIVIIVLGNTVVDIVILVLGILIAVKGIAAVIDVLRKERKNALEIVFAALTVVVGILLAFGNGRDIMIMIVGILLAIDGVLGLIGSLKK